MNIIDVAAAANLLFAMGSFFIAMGILIDLKGGVGYTLAKGWVYILPAVLVYSVAEAINFFNEWNIFTTARYARELVMVLFSVLLFVGLLVQYLAIREAVSSRGR